MGRAMKDSGIEWIGEVPQEWEVSRLSKCFIERSTKVSDYDYEPLSVTKQGIVKQLETAAKTDAHDARKLVCKGDFVINSRSDRKQSCGLSEYDGSVSLINIVLNNKSYNSNYVKYLLKNYGFAEEFYRWGTGIVADLWSTNFTKMKRIMLPVPPVSIQQHIAEFLDEKCKEIDEIIKNTKATIEEYKTYKKSLVVETVMHGINSDSETKKTQIEYIQDIPVNWSLRKIKHVLIPLKRDVLETDDVITCFRDGTVTLRKNKREDGFTFSDTENGYQGVESGDLVIHGMDAFAGAIGISDSRGKCTPVVHVCDSQENKKYYMYFLRALAMNDVLMALSDGIRIRSSDYRNWSKLAKIIVAVPPKDEQKRITDYLDTRCAEIDTLISKKQQIIIELETYKKSLIYECVTGKVEV